MVVIDGSPLGVVARVGMFDLLVGGRLGSEVWLGHGTGTKLHETVLDWVLALPRLLPLGSFVSCLLLGYTLGNLVLGMEDLARGSVVFAFLGLLEALDS